MQILKASLLISSFVINALALAAPSEIRCTGEGETRWVSATLTRSPQYGLIAVLTDNYDTTQRTNPDPRGNYWMNCANLGSSIQCRGTWNARRIPTTATFTKDADGNISVRFRRSLRDSLVQLPCQRS